MPPEPFYLDSVRPVDSNRIAEVARQHSETPSVVGRGVEQSQLQISMLAAECIRRLGDVGIHVSQSSDFDYAMHIIAGLGKPYLTDFLSPQKNDFFEENSFWLVLNDDAGEPAGITGCRIDHTGREPLSVYSTRKLRNLYPEESHVPIRSDRLPRLADEIMGKVVYTGDFFMSNKVRTTSRNHLRTIALLQYCLIFLKWSDFDWLYAFLRDRDVRRGAAWMYHFPRTYPMAHSWTSPPSDQTGDNWLAAMSRLEMIDLFSAYFAAPDRL